jgi:putative transposase
MADEGTRKVLSWRVSNTMDADFCIEALEEALAWHGRPEIFNTDSKNDGVGNLSTIPS